MANDTERTEPAPTDRNEQFRRAHSELTDQYRAAYERTVQAVEKYIASALAVRS